jgi:hypothetical protein
VIEEGLEMLIACLVAFAILIAAWVVLPDSAEKVQVIRPAGVEATKRDTVTVSQGL